ncbi:MAG: DUF460 domain-containing protein, partial [Candidatus Aenigmarchaeota archaeon]|nr:DUF460 domain-containing protein [Candidatus Aenigmarchaeota archaeon]
SIRSGRNLSKSAVAEMISSQGDPVIIASDTFPAPRAIEKLAAAFFARLVTPTENLKREDKASIAKDYAKKYYQRKPVWGNRHERDSLVAAVYAWKRYRALVRRIEEKVPSETENPGLVDFVRRNVLVARESIDTSRRQFLRRKGNA